MCTCKNINHSQITIFYYCPWLWLIWWSSSIRKLTHLGKPPPTTATKLLCPSGRRWSFMDWKALVIRPTVHNQSKAWPTNYMGQQQIGLNNNILRAWPMMWTSDGGGADGCGDGWWLDKFECVHDKLFYRLQWIELLSIVCTTIPHSDQILVNVDPRIRLCLQGISECAEWNCVTFPRVVRSSCCIVYE